MIVDVISAVMVTAEEREQLQEIAALCDPYVVDWREAPEEADCHTVDASGSGMWWYGIPALHKYWDSFEGCSKYEWAGRGILEAHLICAYPRADANPDFRNSLRFPPRRMKGATHGSDELPL
jgi:hypothetical protein